MQDDEQLSLPPYFGPRWRELDVDALDAVIRALVRVARADARRGYQDARVWLHCYIECSGAGQREQHSAAAD